MGAVTGISSLNRNKIWICPQIFPNLIVGTKKNHIRKPGIILKAPLLFI